MKKIILPALLALALMESCAKTDTTCPVPNVSVPDAELDSVRQYLTANNITNAVFDSRGFYYSISDSGTGRRPTACNTVLVDYVGTYTNGYVFDRNHAVSFLLTQVIDGWKLGIPLVKEGGVINLYLPPSLGYGATGTATIPANTVLIFTVNMVQIKS
ncbi:FKBP-type peptidyl-prolyl cis-trans isomerase [Chitinophagaceae bacterium MMS25-I14]